jgi:sporulation protein YlmC with PRC-barrel domain
MFDVDDIRDWHGLAVVDQDGSKIGSLEAVYFDTSTQEASFATVKVGFPGVSRLVFVPLAGARVAPRHVRVMVDKKTAKEAPSIDLSGQLEAGVEPEIFAHYGMPYQLGATGERRLGRR